MPDEITAALEELESTELLLGSALEMVAEVDDRALVCALTEQLAAVRLRVAAIRGHVRQLVEAV